LVSKCYKKVRRRALIKSGKRDSAVIFDLDNTLVDTYGIYRNAKLKLAKKIKKSGGKIAHLNRFVQKLFKIDKELCQKFHTWNYDQRQLVTRACKMTDCKNCNIETLTEDYEAELKKIPKLFRNAKATLKTLKQKGLYLALLSEGTKEQGNMVLQNHKLDKIFDLTWFLKNKEEKHINLIVKKLQNMGYAKIYCIGDSIRKDIRPANSVGTQTIWIPSRWETEKLEQQYDKPKHKIKKIQEILNIIK